MAAIDYATTPAEGLELDWSGQIYELIRAMSFTVRGEHAAELHWVTTCPVCQKDYLQKTGLHKKFMRQRCKECDPKGEIDQAARRAYVEATKALKRKEGRLKVQYADWTYHGIEEGALTRQGMTCKVVTGKGSVMRRVRFLYVPGADYSLEPVHIRAGLEDMAAEYADLVNAFLS